MTPDALEKLKTASAIATAALQFAVSNATAGTIIYDLCCAVDAEIDRLCGERELPSAGVGFPCAVSVNDVICHFSPTAGDATARKVALADGDLAKIELGVQVDRWPAFLCHSLVIGATGPVSGRAADLLAAAWNAATETARLLKPGVACLSVAKQLAPIPADFGVQYTQGLMTHVIARNNLAGDKGIVYRPTPDQHLMARKEASVVAPSELYLVDVVVSSGTHAVARPSAHRTSIFKRSTTNNSLRLSVSRELLSDVTSQHGALPFSVRKYAATEGRTRIALKECLTAGVVHSYDVISDMDDSALTARFAFTVLTGSDADQSPVLLTLPPQPAVNLPAGKQLSPALLS